MGQFNVADYVPVHERMMAFYEKHPQGRLITEIVEHDKESGMVVIKASAFRERDDAEPAATGHAFEIRGAGYVNATSHIENAETSAIGRALANLGFKITRGIASQEEMQKVERMQSEGRTIDYSQSQVPPPPMGRTPQYSQEPPPPPEFQSAQAAGSYQQPQTAPAPQQQMPPPPQQRQPNMKPPLGGSAGPADAASGPQLNALGAIARRNNMTVEDMVQQEFSDIGTPAHLSKRAASYLIDTYGGPR